MTSLTGFVNKVEPTGPHCKERQKPGLSCLLMFQHAGRFLPVAELPSVAIAHVAEQIYLEAPMEFGYDRRTLNQRPVCYRGMSALA
jgi:hypothetical protein